MRASPHCASRLFVLLKVLILRVDLGKRVRFPHSRLDRPHGRGWLRQVSR